MATDNVIIEKKTTATSPTWDVIAMCIGMILLMFKSNRILYVRYLPDTPVYFLAFVCIFCYAAMRWKELERLTMFKGICIALLSVIFIYDRLMLGDLSMQSMLCMAVTVFAAAVLVQAPLADKKVVLKYFTIAVELILLLALAGWIPFLCGVEKPHFQDNSESYYKHQVYYLFNTFTMSSPADIYRFAGPFLEPGHLGSMCVYLLYIDQFNLRKFGNIVLLLSTLMSLSLAAYGLMVGGVILVLIDKRKYIAMAAMAAVFVLIGVGAASYLNGENVLNQAIVSRLEVTEDGEIAGNNRYTTFFKDTFKKYLKSDRIWFGAGRDAYSSRSDSSGTLMMGNAGYKRYFYLRGIVGSTLIVMFLLVYFSRYMSFRSFGFLIVYVISNLIRDYPTKEMWMFLFLIAIPILYYESGREKEKRKIGHDPQQ